MIEARPGAPPNKVRVQRALLSTYDKAGLAPFAAALADLGVALVSSGGTARCLRAAGLEVEAVSQATGFPEILGGRVKTLHPRVHGGLLMRRGDAADAAECARLGILPIDLVVANLYPFEEAVSGLGVSDAAATENIDIGGPALVRAAAKNFFHVAAVTAPESYDAVLHELRQHRGALTLATRRHLALAAFRHTAAYDRAIARYLEKGVARLPGTYGVHLPMRFKLRYGENPHQAGAVYGFELRGIQKLHGKALSYNNFLDTDAALRLMAEFAWEGAEPVVAIFKHTNPCGVASAPSLDEAYAHAFATDTQSPFGGIVAMNRACTLSVARAIDRVFTEIVIAPRFEADALDFLKRKRNRRLIEAGKVSLPQVEARHVAAGVLCQETDKPLAAEFLHNCRCVTHRAPSHAERRDLDFAWRVVKHVKSNAIVFAKGQRTLGIGAGQMSRIDASELAVWKARKSGLDISGSVLASDAFFPFADGLLAAAKAGAHAVVQPGGSIRDQEVIRAADANAIAMVFAGNRHFRH